LATPDDEITDALWHEALAKLITDESGQVVFVGAF
jgi:hypothetical protein